MQARPPKPAPTSSTSRPRRLPKWPAIHLSMISGQRRSRGSRRPPISTLAGPPTEANRELSTGAVRQRSSPMPSAAELRSSSSISRSMHSAVSGPSSANGSLMIPISPRFVAWRKVANCKSSVAASSQAARHAAARSGDATGHVSMGSSPINSLMGRPGNSGGGGRRNWVLSPSQRGRSSKLSPRSGSMPPGAGWKCMAQDMARGVWKGWTSTTSHRLRAGSKAAAQRTSGQGSQPGRRRSPPIACTPAPATNPKDMGGAGLPRRRPQQTGCPDTSTGGSSGRICEPRPPASTNGRSSSSRPVPPGAQRRSGGNT
mmetsp:Transcript_19974/g.60230  ORF Transcript_19974/g.60230 Transcript_19974/m.60230 type:complete len:315 (-) Transcript_19974:171-1115(-)